MSTPTLADLMTSSTPQEVLALELQIASGLGLPTTAWQPVQAIPTLFNINATIAADYSTTVAYLAQGGYASLATLMVDGNGPSAGRPRARCGNRPETGIASRRGTTGRAR